LALFLVACGSERPVTYDPEYEINLPISTAREMYGMHEEKNRKELRDYLGVDPYYTEWCAAFVNAVLHENYIKGSESVSNYPLTARSFISYGQRVDPTEIDISDIVVFPRGNKGWQGHVGFFAGHRTLNGVDYYIILGGNQNDQVTYELYPANKAIAIRRIPSPYKEPPTIEDLSQERTEIATAQP